MINVLISDVIEDIQRFRLKGGVGYMQVQIFNFVNAGGS